MARGAGSMPEWSGITIREGGYEEMPKLRGFWSASGPEYRVNTPDRPGLFLTTYWVLILLFF